MLCGPLAQWMICRHPPTFLGAMLPGSQSVFSSLCDCVSYIVRKCANATRPNAMRHHSLGLWLGPPTIDRFDRPLNEI